jgi:hypothetical protein
MCSQKPSQIRTKDNMKLLVLAQNPAQFTLCVTHETKQHKRTVYSAVCTVVRVQRKGRTTKSAVGDHTAGRYMGGFPYQH